MKHCKADWKLLVYGKNFSVAGGTLIWKIFHEIVERCLIFKICRLFFPWTRKFLWENSPISCLRQRILPTSWEQNQEGAVSLERWNLVLQLIPLFQCCFHALVVPRVPGLRFLGSVTPESKRPVFCWNGLFLCYVDWWKGIC